MMRGGRQRKRVVLIHIDEGRRDVPVSLALGRLFEQAGCRVLFSTRRSTLRFLRRVRCDAVLVPSLFLLPYEEIPSDLLDLLWPSDVSWRQHHPATELLDLLSQLLSGPRRGVVVHHQVEAGFRQA